MPLSKLYTFSACPFDGDKEDFVILLFVSIHITIDSRRRYITNLNLIIFKFVIILVWGRVFDREISLVIWYSELKFGPNFSENCREFDGNFSRIFRKRNFSNFLVFVNKVNISPSMPFSRLEIAEFDLSEYTNWNEGRYNNGQGEERKISYF